MEMTRKQFIATLLGIPIISKIFKQEDRYIKSIDPYANDSNSDKNKAVIVLKDNIIKTYSNGKYRGRYKIMYYI